MDTKPENILSRIASRIASCLILGFLLTSVSLFSMLSFSQTCFADVNKGQLINSIPTLKDTAGRKFAYSNLVGKYTIVAFFSIYSERSDELLDYLDRFAPAPGLSAPLQVIGVDVDPSEKDLRTFLKKNKVSFRVLMDLTLTMSARFSIKEMPTLFLIDPKGVVQAASEGFDVTAPEAFEAQVVRKSGSATPGVDSESARVDKIYQEKKMISAGAKTAKFCPNLKGLLLYISDDNILWKYDTRKTERKEITTGVSSASWSPDGASMVFSKNGSSGVWILKLNGNLEKIAPAGHNPVCSPRCEMAAYIVNDDEVWVWRQDTGKRLRTQVKGKKVDWSPDGNLIMVTDDKNRLWLISPFAANSLKKKIEKIIK